LSLLYWRGNRESIYSKVNVRFIAKKVQPISDEFAEYALNLAATNIVLLVGIYKRGIRVKLE